MKDTCFTIEFLSHCLANSVGPDGNRDHFQRDSGGKIIFQQSWFYSAFGQAISLTRIRGIKPGDIHMNLSFSAKTAIYSRRYGHGKYRTHEAIFPGTMVTFKAIVADHISQTDLGKILERMGNSIGISPYGYRLGYGKFNLKSVQVADSDAAIDQPLTDH